MDAAEYKHLVLGMIFLKYISDTFLAHQEKILQIVSDPSSDFYLGDDIKDHELALEDKDYYVQENIFWVPEKARWEYIRNNAKDPKIFLEGELIDKAFIEIEKENLSLRGKLDKRFGASELEEGKMAELVDLISKIGFASRENSSDILGEVYEYFLGKFAVAEGKNGGQFYTPSHVVKTLVAVLSPYKGRVYDPCCGSGGMFIHSESFVKSHGGNRDDISIYGQESNPTTWRLASMNLAIRQVKVDLGKEHYDTFSRDQHPDQKFDFILANPPFNISDWGGEKYENDKRWIYGRPPVSNANYAWLEHILWKLAPNGRAGVVLANGSLSSNSKIEKSIRKKMLESNVIEAIVSLPNKLFINFKGGVCIWFLSKRQAENRNKKDILFIDARDMGTIKDRTNRFLSAEDIKKIATTIHSWKAEGEGNKYEDIIGFCHSASYQEIENNDFFLVPGLYVGIPNDPNKIPFKENMNNLKTSLEEYKLESQNLDQQITDLLKNF